MHASNAVQLTAHNWIKIITIELNDILKIQFESTIMGKVSSWNSWNFQSFGAFIWLKLCNVTTKQIVFWNYFEYESIRKPFGVSFFFCVLFAISKSSNPNRTEVFAWYGSMNLNLQHNTSNWRPQINRIDTIKRMTHILKVTFIDIEINHTNWNHF